MARMHSDSVQGKTDVGLLDWPNHPGETWQSRQEEGEEEYF
jgi:hypothetical protein